MPTPPPDPRQRQIASTLPTLRTARAEWEGALAAVEELEKEVERANAAARAAREALAAGEKELRHRSLILREVMSANRQEVIEDVVPPEETR